MSNDAVDIREYFPIQNIEKGYMIHGNGDFTAGIKLILPEVFTYSKEDAIEFNNVLSDALKALPNGTIVHKQDFFYVSRYKSEYEKYDQPTKLANLEMYDTKKILSHYCNVYVTFGAGGNMKENPILTNVDFIFKRRTFKNLQARLDEAEDRLRNFVNAFNSMKSVRAFRMTNKDLGGALYDYWTSSYESPNIDGSWKDKFLDDIYVEEDLIKTGQQYQATISLQKQPSSLYNWMNRDTSPGEVYRNETEYVNDIRLNTSVTYPIGLGLPIDHVLNTIIYIEDNESIIGDLKKESQQLNMLSSLGDANAKFKQERIVEYEESITEHDYTGCRVHVSVTIRDLDKKSLKEQIGFVQTAFGRMTDSSCWVENMNNIELFWACSPGNARAVPKDRQLITAIKPAVVYWHKETHYFSDETGVMFNDRFGAPVVLNMWDSKHLTAARNMVMFGPTGTGKSVTINHLICENFGNGNHVIMVDVGGSYLKTSHLLKGVYFDTQDHDKLSFNPFLCQQDASGNYKYISSSDDGDNTDEFKYAQINFVYSIVAYVWRKKEVKSKISDEARAILKDMIVAYYDYVNAKREFPDFTGFVEFAMTDFKAKHPNTVKFFDYDSFELICAKFTSRGGKEGSHSKLLNAKSNPDFVNDRLIVYDLKAVKEDDEINGIVLMVILQSITQKLNKLPKDVRKSIFIEEAVDFLDGDFGEAIGGFYRKIRKDGGQCGIITQSIKYLEHIDPMVRDSILGNTAIKIMLDHTQVRAEGGENFDKLLMERLAFTKNDLKMLSSVKMHDDRGYRDVLIKMGSHSRVFRVQQSSKALAAYTTNPEELAQIFRIFKEVGNMGAAIEIYVQQKIQSS